MGVWMLRAMSPLGVAALDRAPRLGWVDAPSPLEAAPALASELGLSSLLVKRDDLLPALLGGGKPRKLDFLLAAAPFTGARRWAAAGAIGSGALVALSAAAEQLGRELDAHLFWTEPSTGVLDNLAFTASHAASLTFYRSRASLALTRPALLRGGVARGAVVVPPGGTSPVGMLGFVRAGLELAAQLRDRGEEPERVYLPLGSAGSAVGLAMGLALAGCGAEVRAIAVVERPLSTRRRVDGLARALGAELARWGVETPGAPLSLVVDHDHVGRGYAVATEEGLAACAALGAAGIEVEPIYGGKAAAALLADARGGRVSRAVFWHTARRGPLPRADDWRARLPPALRRRLDVTPGALAARRRLLLALGVGATGVAVARVTGYDADDWRGLVLSGPESRIVEAAAEALLASATAEQLRRVALGVDAYLRGMSPRGVAEVHALLAFVEHGTLLGGRMRRLTSLSPAEREQVVSSLARRGGLLRDAARGLEDLCALGFYQQPSTWPALGYTGPMVGPGRRGGWPTYEALGAPPGALPRAASR